MKNFCKRAIVAATFAGALIVPSHAASAAPPVVTGGLINVTIVDVLSGNQVTVQVPVSVAANICDVSVAVLAQDLSDGAATCSNDQQTITLSRQHR